MTLRLSGTEAIAMNTAEAKAMPNKKRTLEEPPPIAPAKVVVKHVAKAKSHGVVAEDAPPLSVDRESDTLISDLLKLAELVPLPEDWMD